MSFLPASKVTILKARLAQKVSSLSKAYIAMDESLVKFKSYKFDSGEGSQSAIYRDVEDLQKTIDILERQIDSIMIQLNGTGIVNIVLRRRNHCL